MMMTKIMKKITMTTKGDGGYNHVDDDDDDDGDNIMGLIAQVDTTKTSPRYKGHGMCLEMVVVVCECM